MALSKALLPLEVPSAEELSSPKELSSSKELSSPKELEVPSPPLNSQPCLESLGGSRVVKRMSKARIVVAEATLITDPLLTLFIVISVLRRALKIVLKED